MTAGEALAMAEDFEKMDKWEVAKALVRLEAKISTEAVTEFSKRLSETMQK